LFKQERMQDLEVKEMKSFSKTDLKDVLLWMSIKNACRPRALIITKLSKEWCILLTAEGRLSWATRKHDKRRCGPPSTWETYSSKMGLWKIRNLEHRYETTKAQFHKKANGAQFSIDERPKPPKEINSRA
jgi:hypothetical protein